jgi:hypothetical protein
LTITNPTATATQQCFITVVPKASWNGGIPDLAGSQLVEGNYEVTLSGGGGGGGGGAGSEREHGRTEVGNGGGGGTSAVPVTTMRYLEPGIYRATIGAGGQGGAGGPNGERVARHGWNGSDGAPTSLSKTSSGDTVAGFSGAESWNGKYPLVAVAYTPGTPSYSGQHAADGGAGMGGRDADRGAAGGNGYIKLALKDPVPQAAPAMSSSNETMTAPAPTAIRPARKDRN